MEYFETLPDYSPNIRINFYYIPLFGEFCLSNLLMLIALCVGHSIYARALRPLADFRVRTDGVKRNQLHCDVV